MTQEDKDLLLKDLCARFPYGVAVKFRVNEVVAIEKKFIYNVDGEYSYITDGKSYLTLDIIKALFNNHLDDIKPYLFPLSSMTEEQKYDFYCRFIENDCNFDDFKEFYLDNGMWHKMLTSIDDIEEIIDWFNKNHFDFRCLIPKGLAIDAVGLNIYS
jgi:hypothetical protein